MASMESQFPPFQPVGVVIPTDILNNSTEMDNDESPPIKYSTPSRWEHDEISSIARKIRTKRPVFIVGDGLFSGDIDIDSIRQLIDIVDPIILSSGLSDSLFDFNELDYRGSVNLIDAHLESRIFEGVKVVINLGASIWPSMFPPQRLPWGREVYSVMVSPYMYSAIANYPTDHVIIGNVSEFCGQLVEILTCESMPVTAKERRSTSSAAKMPAIPVLDEFLGKLRNALEASVDHWDEDYLIYDESLSASKNIRYIFSPRRENTYFEARGGAIGSALPAVIGIGYSNTERKPLVFSGDGGAIFTIQSLWSIVTKEIDATIVVINNNGYHTLAINAAIMHGSTGQSYPRESFQNIDPGLNFSKISESFGVPCYRICENSDIESLDIVRFLAKPGPKMFEVVI